MKDLEGLEYDELVMDHNVHKLIDNVTKKQGNGSVKIDIDKGSIWLAVSLGQLNESTPDKALEDSIKDIIIVDKNKLVDFVDNSSKEYLTKVLQDADLLKKPEHFDEVDTTGKEEFLMYLRNIQKIISDRHGPEHIGKDGDLICEIFTMQSLIKFFDNL